MNRAFHKYCFRRWFFITRGASFYQTADQKAKLSTKGDLLFNWWNESKHIVGKTAMFSLDGKYLLASFLFSIRPDSLHIKNPLPLLETQRSVFAEIEKEQALVAANRELIALYEEKIKRVVEGVWS